RDRSRRDHAALPALPEVADLQRALPAEALWAAPVLAGDEVYLLAVSRDEPPRVVRGAGPASDQVESLAGLRGCLVGQLARYRSGLRLGPHERAELDERLEAVGRGPLGTALSAALGEPPARWRRLYWAPDGPLHGLPVHALRRRGRYL